jgi:hypothetical protein
MSQSDEGDIAKRARITDLLELIPDVEEPDLPEAQVKTLKIVCVGSVGISRL